MLAGESEFLVLAAQKEMKKRIRSSHANADGVFFSPWDAGTVLASSSIFWTLNPSFRLAYSQDQYRPGP